ncbi:hypothetical protein [Natronobeatus ordinarius]|uniref:hypothetical protein n=1 Tax=Natronobeatus ordinarius TaxID=2963433 RepID=UPI0020CE6447|nr:hypothetical protein [Natronobeatus ordinarius]
MAVATTADGDAQETVDELNERALTQYLTVLEDYDRARGVDGLYMVVSQSGRVYFVDARLGACECPDHQYRNRRCKYIRRVAFVIGAEPIPIGIDPQLALHVSGEPILEYPTNDRDPVGNPDE